MKRAHSLYELRKRKLDGSPYTVHAILVGGLEIYAQLSPMSEEEIESRIHAHLHPVVRPPVKEVHAKSGPKPKRAATVNARGFLWDTE